MRHSLKKLFGKFCATVKSLAIGFAANTQSDPLLPILSASNAALSSKRMVTHMIAQVSALKISNETIGFPLNIFASCA